MGSRSGNRTPVSGLLKTCSAVLISLLLTAAASGPSRGGETAAPPRPTATVHSEAAASERLPLFFFRQATKIKGILDKIAAVKGSALEGLIVEAPSENELLLYGEKGRRESAKRVIAAFDLPLSGVSMEMWGIQISSSKPDKMAQVMTQIRSDLDVARSAVRDTFKQVQIRAAVYSNGSDNTDSDFAKVFTGLGYTYALNRDRSLSLADVLLRLIASPQPGKASAALANDLQLWLSQHEKYHWFVEQLQRNGRTPFQRFFEGRGLRFDGKNWAPDGPMDTNVGPHERERKTMAYEHARISRAAVLRFAVEYRDYVYRKEGFRPYYLQQYADELNSRLQETVQALSQDMQDLFVLPTLERIRQRVARFGDVEYSQVGRTQVASLSGIATKIEAGSVSAFDVTPPLRLSELLSTADKLSKQASGFVPTVPVPGTQDTQEAVVTGGIPVSKLIGLLAAFGEERSVWRELATGISLDITPNVLRNASSAELNIDLTIGDPQAGTRESGVRPISRVTKHNLKTSVYIDSLDLFDLSTFSSQATLDGGRGYVPIIGTIWRGIFSDIPVIGDLFSWKKGSRKVYHQSIVLTSSIINPTAMNVALLLELDRDGAQGEERYWKQRDEVRDYIYSQRN